MEQQRQDKSYPQRLGAGMIAFAWVLFLGLLMLLFNRFLEKQNNPNENVLSSSTSNYQEVVLLQNRFGHYVASGEINGYPVDFMLDTGATQVSVPSHLANRLRLKKGPAMQVTTANGTIEVYSTHLDRVSLGNIVLSDVRAGINPYMRENEVLLGMSFLKKLEMIQRDGKLTLRQYQR